MGFVVTIGEKSALTGVDLPEADKRIRGWIRLVHDGFCDIKIEPKKVEKPK